jgi:hypothetical protein
MAGRAGVALGSWGGVGLGRSLEATVGVGVGGVLTVVLTCGALEHAAMTTASRRFPAGVRSLTKRLSVSSGGAILAP